MFLTAQTDDKKRLRNDDVYNWANTSIHGISESPADFLVNELVRGTHGRYLPWHRLTNMRDFTKLTLVMYVPEMARVAKPRNWVLQRLGTALMNAWKGDAGTLKIDNEVGKLMIYDLGMKTSLEGRTFKDVNVTYASQDALRAIGVNPASVPWASREW